MDLNKLAVETRPRSPWESADLGLLMAKRWFVPLISLWLILTLPLWLLGLFLPTSWLWLQLFLLWWLKPVFERPLLFYLSRAVFSEETSIRECFSRFPALCRMQLFSSLLWRRFSPTRSMDLPVIQLEGLQGSQRTKRLSVLHRIGAVPAAWLTIIGVHMELFLGISAGVLVWAFIPVEMDIDVGQLFIENTLRNVQLANSLFTFLGMALVAPFYVASGFALYLNRRIHIEAWDLEIEFRQMLASFEKRKQRSQPATHASPWWISCAAVIFVFAALSCVSPMSYANTDDTPEYASSISLKEVTAENAKDMIETVKASDPFHIVETHTSVDMDKLFEGFELNDDKGDSDSNWGGFEWILMLVAGVASIGEYILWFIVLVLVTVLVIYYRDWLKQFFVRAPEQLEREVPKTMFGMDVRKESLPEHVGDEALTLWRKGEYRKAMSLLYRGTLAEVIHAGVPLEESFTEQECVQAAKKAACIHSDAAFDYFYHLTQLWRAFAYGHITPDESSALDLFARFQQVWQTPSHDKGITDA